jgi:hypothetical protein
MSLFGRKVYDDPITQNYCNFSSCFKFVEAMTGLEFPCIADGISVYYHVRSVVFMWSKGLITSEAMAKTTAEWLSKGLESAVYHSIVKEVFTSGKEIGVINLK